MQRLLTAGELSALTGVCVSTLLHLAQQGRVPSVRFGRCVRFPEQAVEEFVEAQLRGAQQAASGDDAV